MGAVGGMLGLSGGANGTGFSPTSGTSGAQLNTAYNQNQSALQGQQGLLTALQGQNGLQNQSQVYNQLQNVAQGQGPNPAQAQLAQATGANVANQAALMAGQRGAGANVGLLARQAAQQGAATQQQAAGQGASMQAQQSLAALGQAQQQANTMAGQQIGQTNANVSAQQGEQGILQGANTAASNNQTQLANTQMQGQQALAGGLMGGGASGIMSALAGGGEVQKFAGGGVPQSMFGNFINSGSSQAQGSMPGISGSNSGAAALQKGVSSIGQKKPAQSVALGTSSDPDVSKIANKADPNLVESVGPMSAGQATPNTMVGAHGGNVGGRLKSGGHVPGEAKISGNSYSNDTVKALLSPGEVVIPRSVMQSKDPIRGAAQFVQSVMAKKGKRS